MESIKKIILLLINWISGLTGSDCSDSYELKTGAIIDTYYPENAGIYQKVGIATNDWPIYRKVNGTDILRFVTDGSSQGAWLFSEIFFSLMPKIVRTADPQGDCPGPESGIQSVILASTVSYNASQKHESTLLHTYVLNEFLTADSSCTTKHF